MIPMAQHHNITPLAWSPLAGGVLAGKYSKEDLEKEDDGGGRKQMSQSLGQLNERSLEIGYYNSQGEGFPLSAHANYPM